MSPIESGARLDPTSPHDAYIHIRIVIGMVTGLALTRLLSGLARLVQHPSRDRIYLVHLGWVAFLLIAVMLFWWFEFALGGVTVWTFQRYAFVVAYASLFFFTSTLLFPDTMSDYDGFADYFHARRPWFYGLLAAIFLADLADTALKGTAHLRSFGTLYPVMTVLLAAIAVTAIFIRDRRFHAVFVIAVLAIEVWWILRQFDVLA